MIDFCNQKWDTEMSYGIIHTGQPWMWYDEDCVKTSSRMADGILIHKGSGQSDNYAELIATNKPKEIHHWDGKTYNPTVACGLLRSVDTFGYGRFSAEIMLPKGKSLWSCFWLCGSGRPWPECGEIDICEAWANKAAAYYRFPFDYRVTTNIHFAYDGVPHTDIGSTNTSIFVLPSPTKNFVKYEVEWRPNSITFFANGKEIRRVGWDIAQHLVGKPQHVIFDCWTSGEDFTCDSPMKIRNFEYKPIEIL